MLTDPAGAGMLIVAVAVFDVSATAVAVRVIVVFPSTAAGVAKPVQ
jgi:hypothetical protein